MEHWNLSEIQELVKQTYETPFLSVFVKLLRVM